MVCNSYFITCNLSIFRYYVAEGVRIYSQETWRQTTEGEGRHLVEKYINNVVSMQVF
jgi:hypothetical protein